MRLRVVVSPKILRLGVIAKRLALAIGRFVGVVQNVEIVTVDSDPKLSISKIPQDTVAVVDDITVPLPLKNVFDGIGIDDGQPYFFEDYVAEDYVLGTQVIKVFTKSPILTGATALSATALTLQKSFSDGFSATDDIDGELSDSDDVLLEVFKSTDTASSTSDVSIISVGKALVNSSEVSASGLLRSQNYTEDMTYFAEDYVGESRVLS